MLIYGTKEKERRIKQELVLFELDLGQCFALGVPPRALAIVFQESLLPLYFASRAVLRSTVVLPGALRHLVSRENRYRIVVMVSSCCWSRD